VIDNEQEVLAQALRSGRRLPPVDGRLRFRED
jgi:hypothetical protein